MTVATVLQDAAIEIGLSHSPTTFVGNTDLTARRLLRYLLGEMEDLAFRHEWERLINTRTDTTNGTSFLHNVPDDILRFIPDATWTWVDPSRSDATLLGAALNERDWQRVFHENPSSASNARIQWWTVRDDQILTWPATNGHFVQYLSLIHI